MASGRRVRGSFVAGFMRTRGPRRDDYSSTAHDPSVEWMSAIQFEGVVGLVRIVAWNINQGAEAKAVHLLELEPDVAVLPECADVPEIGDGALVRAAWTGRNPRKGLAVFVRPEAVAVRDESWDAWREWWLPIRISLPSGTKVSVLAVWAFHHRGEEPGPRRGRSQRAIEHYRPFLEGGRTIVIGDFNDNARWDTPSNPSFARTFETLGQAGYRSVYHARSGEVPGAETQASFYWYRHRDRPYLVDHAFIPESWLASVRHFEFGDPARWLAWSDHVPTVLDLDI
jgi:exodeoxyribonuclease III